MSIEFDVNKIQEDINITVDWLLKATTNEISKAFFDKVAIIDNSIKYPATNKNEEIDNTKDTTKQYLFENIISEEASHNLYANFSNIFSQETKEFIMQFLSEWAQWELKIIVDDTLRNWPNSSKKFNILVQWRDEENNEFHHSSEFKNINSIEIICNELFNFHYLWLWLKWWLLQSIVFERPKRSKTKKIDDDDVNIDTLIKTRFIKKYTLEEVENI